MYNPYTIGKHVYLRTPTLEDVEGKWHEWISDEDTTKYILGRYWPNTADEQRHFYESLKDDRSRLVLSIVNVEKDKHIGVCNLSSINWVHRFCEMAIIIGDKEYRKGVYAYESWALMLKIAFLRLNMKSVCGAYIESNERTKNILEVAGFSNVGRYDEFCEIDGKQEDLVLVMLKKEQWLARNENSITQQE